MPGESISEHNNNSNVNHFGEGDNDLLQRRKPGEDLSRLMQGFENPRVVALNGNWGTGKTWFLERWAKHHRDRFADTTVVYFDAFEHDYLSDPLPALVTALGKEIPDGNIGEIKKVAFRLAKPLARKALSIAAPGTSEVVNLLGEFIKALADEREYWANEKERMEGMGKFRSALEALIPPENGRRLIFVVDELDRCRPDYALEVLEVIKHFFSVDNVHFILGVNLKALEDMVRVRYGSKIDAAGYLEKFIQVRLELPEEVAGENREVRNVSRYLDYLCREMEVPDHIGKWLKIRIKLVARANPISLRQIEHIVSAVTLAGSEAFEYEKDTTYYPSGHIKNFPEGRYAVMVDLIIAKIVCSDLHPRFLDATITPDELHSYLGFSDSLPTLHPQSHDERRSHRENSTSKPDQDFDKGAWNLAFDTWLFITQTENETPVLGNVIQDRKMQIGRSLFGPGFIPGDFTESEVKGLPRKIQQEWLDLFQLHDPT
ncbi:MAG: P-loop NTPase fold protein [Paracoccaceae bacterium]|nr:P-loop NTPase fold protein [Paracoccaceae bacterium]MDE2676130.1 P-loop NTPase fold protein [Paracoccaceae bacterium]